MCMCVYVVCVVDCLGRYLRIWDDHDGISIGSSLVGEQREVSVNGVSGNVQKMREELRAQERSEP